MRSPTRFARVACGSLALLLLMQCWLPCCTVARLLRWPLHEKSSCCVGRDCAVYCGCHAERAEGEPGGGDTHAVSSPQIPKIPKRCPICSAGNGVGQRFMRVPAPRIPTGETEAVFAGILPTLTEPHTAGIAFRSDPARAETVIYLGRLLL